MVGGLHRPDAAAQRPYQEHFYLETKYPKIGFCLEERRELVVAMRPESTRLELVPDHYCTFPARSVARG